MPGPVHCMPRHETLVEQGHKLAETAVEVSKDAMVAINREGQITIFNPAAERLFGYTGAETTGQSLSMLLPEEFREMHQRFVAGYFACGKPDGAIGKTMELEAVRRGGARFPIELSLSSGRCLGEPFVIAVIRDITKRRRAETRQIELLHRLAEVNQELKDFAYVASHDLKTPLRGIAALASWISTDYAEKLDETGQKHLTLLTNRVKRMQNLIDDILRYSRIGRVEENLARTDLNAILSDVVAMIAPPENVQIEFEGTFPTVTCDRTRIAQVFQNLIGNAIQHSDKPTTHVRIGCSDEGDHWRLHVRDNGPGIAAKHHERIFKMFQTLLPCDTPESTGIGLALVRKIVEHCGGQVSVDSAPGEGSTFYFTLPKVPRHSSETGLAALA